ncbi:MAG: hypothetical protein WBA12_16245, partial [Catalinimonas sp.]
PTAHLDLVNRADVLQLLKRLARAEGIAILLSTHELDLALRTCDRLWLLGRAGTLATGLPEELSRGGQLAAAFAPLPGGLRFEARAGRFLVDRGEGPRVALTGDEEGVYWTRRALVRTGCRVVAGGGAEVSVVVVGSTWTLRAEGDETRCDTLEGLLDALARRTARR